MALCFLDTLKTQPLWVLVLCILGSLSIFNLSVRCLNWVYVNFLRLAKNLKKYRSSALASSSSSPVQVQQKHQVFLSFRGDDTRHNFTSHLHKALKKKGIDAYVDYRLEKGDEISEALLTAIQESTISIIVLSENYASSSWCLEELSKIIECKQRMGQKVVPIFYHVDPSDVRHIRGSFKEAFAKQQQRFKDETDKVESWRAALEEVAGLAGHHLRNDRLESEVVEEIAEDILEKLKCKSFVDTKPLVGIDSRVKKIESLLCFDSKDVRIIGIWGMGGIGKTTIAEAVFNRFNAKFEDYCFLNVRNGSKDELVHLQQKLVSKILGDQNIYVDTTSLDASIIDRLQRKKVFIVLDDVNDSKSELLDLLFIKFRIKFGPGSRIIVTSRDKQLLEPVVNEMYKVERLFDDEAIQLFSWYAFGQKLPKKDFLKLSKAVIHFANGVPLVLRVVGSALYGKNKCYWEGHLNKLEKNVDLKIDNMLKISYDGLHYEEEKHIFLDIACFFRGKDRDYVESVLGGCYTSVSSVRSGISTLVDKSLITISHNILEMHDLLQQMAMNIIRQEPNEPGKRRTLCTPKDICHVLENNTGTDKVEGMLLDMSEIREMHLSPTAFKRMYNLKLLKFNYDDFQRKRERKVCFAEQGLESLPNSLCLLHWDDYPLKSLPQKFCPKNLVELCMCNSHIKTLWNGVQELVNLKRLDFKGSHHLIEIPDLSRATALESINLDGCESLVGVHSSIGCLSKLKDLYMRGCRGIEELPSSIEHLVGLKELYLDACEKLKDLPSSISKLKSLETLSLCDCSNITKFPETAGNLKRLFLSGTAIEQVSSSIECLSQLEQLFLDSCAKLCSLPRNIFQLKSLTRLIVSGISKLDVIQERSGTAQISIEKGFDLLDNLDDLGNLEFLSLKDCNLFTFPSGITSTSSLTILNLRGNSFETIPASIEQLLNLAMLDLSHCENLQSLPASIKQLLNLKELDLNYCTRLHLLPELPPCLGRLYAHDCISLEAVSLSSSFTICPMSCEYTYEFINCTELDHKAIWAKTKLGIQQLATEDVKVRKNQYPETSFSICLPGSEIPEWFSFQNEGSSMTIQLPLHLHHHKFVGFALCFVFAPNYDKFDPIMDVHSRFCFKINGDDFRDWYLPKYSGTDHVFVHYDVKLYDYYSENGYHPNEASFEFFCTHEIIKKCGVHLLYAQDDLTEFSHRPSEECNPLMVQPSSPYDPMVEDSNTTKRTCDDYSNNEAESKRLKL